MALKRAAFAEERGVSSAVLKMEAALSSRISVKLQPDCTAPYLIWQDSP
jgi:hypothetical protein